MDCNTGAVHLDIFQDYSTNPVLLTLRRLGAIRGWPNIICSDPGNQVESTSGKLENWFVTMSDFLRTLGSSKNLKWKVSPADSPWRQGRAERRIGIVKIDNLVHGRYSPHSSRASNHPDRSGKDLQ